MPQGSEQSRPSHPRVVIIGLDAFTFDLLDPWFKEGYLPNLARIAKNGARGTLTSGFLPLSPPAWTTITTGKNPGGHGIFGFATLEPGTYRVNTVDARNIQVPRLWDFINREGLTCGLFNVPVTYPVQPLNGYSVGGFLTPDTHRTFTHPKELAEEVFAIDRNYRIMYSQIHCAESPQPYLDELAALIEMRLKVLEHLIRTRPTDFGMFVFMEADWLQHKMWQALQQSGDDRRFYDSSRRIFRLLDDAVGRIMELCGPECNYVLVSDHGAGYHDRVLHINKWLLDNHFLYLKSSGRQWFKRLMERARIRQKIYWVAARLQVYLGFILRPLLRSQMAAGAAGLLDASYEIDWSRTRAYSCDAIGQVHVNLKGREPNGLVSDGPEYDALLADLETKLRQLQDPRTGRAIVTDIKRTRDIYPGPFAKNGPDLLVILDEFRCTSAVSFGFNSDGYFDGVEFNDYGSHRPNGIIMAIGPDIAPGTQIQGAAIADVTPTVLRLLDLPIPADLHGRPLDTMLTAEFLRSHPLKKGDSAGGAAAVGPADEAASSEDLKEKLRALGYL
jgi:predicted AlkP superfamily phosphohydrolase/phosphomutase